MPLSDEIQKFKRHLKRQAKQQVPDLIQTSWARVKSVDWETKRMVATGVVDDLDFHEVLLGLGHTYKKPKVGSLCLLGIIENFSAATHLIHASEVEEVSITIQDLYSTTAKNIDFTADEKISFASNDIQLKAKQTTFNDGVNGGIPIVGLVETNIDKIKEYVETLEAATRTALTALESLVGGPGSLTTSFDGLLLPKDMNFEDMENDKVKH